jgi:UDP-3-O-[3-hydroxymyristoyl] N-acetylglucosamine deacetylase
MTLNQKTVLVVDDEDVIRETVREILTDEGYRVIEAADGSKVMDLIDQENPDIILLDVWMPAVDGIVLLREIKRRTDEVPVIMISGHGSIQAAVAATKLGAFDFIEKPLSLNGLLTTVHRASGELNPQLPPVQSEFWSTSGGKKPGKTSLTGTHSGRSVRQKSLKRSVVACGQGLHSGVNTGVILHPLPPNSGVHFGGISMDATVPAHLNYVRSTDFATSLQRDGVVVGTVEHLLAALHSYGITNLLVKMYGEIPIMDGSALEFCQLIEEAGIEEQEGECTEIVVDRAYCVGADGQEEIRIEPADEFSVRYHLRYPAPVGEQQYTYVYKGAESFRDQIAPARTFGFVKDLEKLERMGLIKGGRLSNCILIDDEKIVNTELRFDDEFVRHKILDIVGDFSLMGRPIRGKVTAKMTGHADNIALLREMAKAMAL